MVKPEPERSASVLQVAHRYYNAMVHAEEGELRQLFEPRACIAGYFEGEFQWLTLDEFIAETKTLVGQHGKLEFCFESMKLDGDIASLCVSGRYAGFWIVDHLLLIEKDKEWIVTSKSFHVRS